MHGLLPSRVVGPGITTAVRSATIQHNDWPYNRSRVITPPAAVASATAPAGVEVITDEMLELEILIDPVISKPTRQHRATLEWTPLLDGFWLTEVLNEDGVIVDSGIGDDPRVAYEKLSGRALPPD